MWPAFKLLQTYLIAEWKELDMAPENIPTEKTALTRRDPCRADWLHTVGCARHASKTSRCSNSTYSSCCKRVFYWKQSAGRLYRCSQYCAKKELVSVEDAEQSAAVKPPTKKRSASCRDKNGEDNEDGEQCAAATKLRRGEDSEEGQTKIVPGACYDPGFNPDRIEEVYTQKKSGFADGGLSGFEPQTPEI